MGSGAEVGSRRALHGVLVAAVAVGVALLVFRVSPRTVWHHTFDLRVYRGAVRWWLDGRPLYDFLRPHTTKGFTYPPFALLVLLPLGLMTETTATMLFTSVSIGLVLVTTRWLVAPVAARHGWTPWVALGIAVPVAFAMEPVRETIGWGQVDLVIATLVLADTAGLCRGRRWAGLGIGLAAAIKVTPGLFIVYLVVTRRWRAAAVASATFGASVVVGLAVDPTARYWTWALWQTDRVGPRTDPNNQSLLGLLARVSAPAAPSHVLWLGAAGLIAIVGMVRAALVHHRGDELAGVTVTGLTACLISPISWVHHLYWVVPATVVLVDITAGSPVVSAWASRRPGVTRVVAGVAALMVAGAFTSSMIWFYARGPGGPRTIIGEDAYVLLLLALVLVLPARISAAAVGDIERPRPSADGLPSDHAAAGGPPGDHRAQRRPRRHRGQIRGDGRKLDRGVLDRMTVGPEPREVLDAGAEGRAPLNSTSTSCSRALCQSIQLSSSFLDIVGVAVGTWGSQWSAPATRRRSFLRVPFHAAGLATHPAAARPPTPRRTRRLRETVPASTPTWR